MVCDECQSKLKRSSQMDMFKSSAADGRSHKVGRHGDSRRLNENKLLSKNRFGNLGASGSKNCRLCKGMLHANQELYCQHCAFKNGLCTMCGKKVMDTSMYTSGQLWDGSEEVVKNVIAKVDEEQRQAKKRKKGRGGIAGAAAASAAKSAAADADAAITQANIFPAETDGGGSDDRAASIDVTFGKEGGLGIAFTDEGWEIREILEGAEMEVLRPGLYLTHIQGQPILQESDERIRCMFGEAGRPVRLTLAQHDPRVRAEPARSKPAPSKKCAAASAARSGEQAAESSAAKGEAAEGGGDIGNGFTYNWKIGLYHNPETGYFYDHQTSTYLHYNAAEKKYRLRHISMAIEILAWLRFTYIFVNWYLHWDQARNAWVEYRRQEALRKMSNISSAAEVATEFSTAQAYSSTS